MLHNEARELLVAGYEKTHDAQPTQRWNVQSWEWDTRGKRSLSTQPGVTAPDVRQKRDEWKQTISPEIADRLVFLDESGKYGHDTHLRMGETCRSCDR